MSEALHFIYAALVLAAASRCVKVAEGAKKRTVHLVFSNHLVSSRLVWTIGPPDPIRCTCTIGL